jgi:hypothetical protein
MHSMKQQVPSSGSSLVVARTGLMLGVPEFRRVFLGADGTSANPDFSRVVSFSWLMWFEGSAGYFVVRILVAGRCLLLSCRLV